MPNWNKDSIVEINHSDKHGVKKKSKIYFLIIQMISKIC